MNGEVDGTFAGVSVLPGLAAPKVSEGVEAVAAEEDEPKGFEWAGEGAGEVSLGAADPKENDGTTGLGAVDSFFSEAEGSPNEKEEEAAGVVFIDAEAPKRGVVEVGASAGFEKLKEGTVVGALTGSVEAETAAAAGAAVVEETPTPAKGFETGFTGGGAAFSAAGSEVGLLTPTPAKGFPGAAAGWAAATGAANFGANGLPAGAAAPKENWDTAGGGPTGVVDPTAEAAEEEGTPLPSGGEGFFAAAAGVVGSEVEGNDLVVSTFASDEAKKFGTPPALLTAGAEMEFIDEEEVVKVGGALNEKAAAGAAGFAAGAFGGGMVKKLDGCLTDSVAETAGLGGGGGMR